MKTPSINMNIPKFGMTWIAGLSMIAFFGTLAGMTTRCSAQNATVVNPIVEGTAQPVVPRRGSAPGPAALPEGFENYRLSPGSTVFFSVFGAPEMNFTLQVDASGAVSVPLLGKVAVGGDSLAQAEASIAQQLSARNLFQNPVVSLELTGYTAGSAVIAGEVQLPGRVALFGPKSVVDVVALAGGFSTSAGSDVQITHSQAGGPDKIEHVHYGPGTDPLAAQQAMVNPGDSVFVARAGIVYVLGAVNRPGGYLMVKGGTMTISQAIAYAQGTTQYAGIKSAYLVRKGEGDNVTQIEVPLKRTEVGASKEIELADGDVVYVKTSGFKEVVINGSGLISSIAVSTIYAIYR